MSPKNKAKELVNNFYKYCNNSINRNYYSKQCSLICVDEIIKDREILKDALFYNSEYWEKVKIEINKL